MKKIFLFCLGIFLMQTSFAFPSSTSFNIQVEDGGVIKPGTYTYTFNIASSQDCLDIEYTETFQVTTDSRGIFNYYLNTSSLDWSKNYYLCLSRDGVLKSISVIGAVPYAYYSNGSQCWQGYCTLADFADTQVTSGNLMPYTSSKYDIGTSGVRWRKLYVQSTGVIGPFTLFNGQFSSSTGSIDMLTNYLTASNYISTVVTGTQPYATTSNTTNTNLSADFLDGKHASFFANASNYAPYNGATDNLSLGIYNITAHQAIFGDTHQAILGEESILNPPFIQSAGFVSDGGEFQAFINPTNAGVGRVAQYTWSSGGEYRTAGFAGNDYGAPTPKFAGDFVDGTNEVVLADGTYAINVAGGLAIAGGTITGGIDGTFSGKLTSGSSNITGRTFTQNLTAYNDIVVSNSGYPPYASSTYAGDGVLVYNKSLYGLSVWQGADNMGFELRGYDDKSGDWGRCGIDTNGDYFCQATGSYIFYAGTNHYLFFSSPTKSYFDIGGTDGTNMDYFRSGLGNIMTLSSAGNLWLYGNATFNRSVGIGQSPTAGTALAITGINGSSSDVFILNQKENNTGFRINGATGDTNNFVIRHTGTGSLIMTATDSYTQQSTTGYISLISALDFYFKLGDNAGARKYNFRDSDGKVVTSIDSRGNMNITGNATFNQLINLKIITLPACGNGVNGSIGRNGTGVYGCKSSGVWSQLF